MPAEVISAMSDAAEMSYIPEGPKDLMGMLESFPHLFEMLGGGLHELGTFMSGLGGILEEQGMSMEEAAGTVDGLFETMSDIFIAVREHAHFWLDGE
jgi:hypothetical protein